MFPANHPLPNTLHQPVNTHSSGEPGCQCHLQIPLQANQGRNQDKHFGNCPKHIPVLEGNKGNDLSLCCWPVQCCCTPGQQVLVSPPPHILCTQGQMLPWCILCFAFWVWRKEFSACSILSISCTTKHYPNREGSFFLGATEDFGNPQIKICL